MLKRLLKRIIIALLVIFAAYMIVSNIAFFQGLTGSYSNLVIIDTDSGNEMDDLFAVVRALIDPGMVVSGLLSSQWNFHEDAQDSSVMISQEINEKILKLLHQTHIPHPVGSSEMIRFSEKSQPQPSEAAEYIITMAKGLPPGEKLKVITLGAVTNLASAILMDSSIIPKLDCYVMGMKYDYLNRVWNKNEFNTRNDLDAMDILLNTKNLELTIMTAITSSGLRFNKQETFNKLSSKGDIWNYLLERWDKKFPGYNEWIMWDVAIIEAILNPKLAKTIEVFTPPENTRRKIRVYTSIRVDAMLKDYWQAVEKYSGY
jgi:purine nucleosidase